MRELLRGQRLVDRGIDSEYSLMYRMGPIPMEPNQYFRIETVRDSTDPPMKAEDGSASLTALKARLCETEVALKEALRRRSLAEDEVKRLESLHYEASQSYIS